MKEKFQLLVVDDEQNQREILGEFLRDLGYGAYLAGSVAEAVKTIQEKPVDLVLSDYKLGDGTGEEILDYIQRENPTVQFVLFTAYGSVKRAVDFMKKGASDYLPKPLDLDELEVKVAKFRKQAALVEENRRLRELLEGREEIPDILFKSARMEALSHVVFRAAQSSANVLITGESGTGKELVARAIHRASARKDKPMLAVNCAALNENLLESELFGHEKGSFTGADRRRAGRFEEASGGTLFLDEVGEIPSPIQVKLLRVLQERVIQRIGSGQDLRVDFRLVAATNRDLAACVADGSFRSDLYYRLNVVHIKIPPLRERKEDVPMLVEHFVEKYAAENGLDIRGVSREALHMLVGYGFPGNVRELENLVERAVVLASSTYLTPDDFPDLRAARPGSLEEDLMSLGLTEAVEALERVRIRKALEESSYVQTKAAEKLGINEKNLRYKMDKYGLARSRGERQPNLGNGGVQ